MKKLYDPFLWMGFNCQRHFEETVYFLLLCPQEFLVLILSTSEGWKAELTSEPPMVLNPGPLNWKSSALTARPFPNNHFLKKLKYFKFHMDSLHLKFTKIWQTFTHTKESQKTRCFLYTVILIFTSNHICTLQRHMKS